MRIHVRVLAFAIAVSSGLSGCASLEGLRAFVQPPQFSQAPDQPSEIRLLPIQAGRPAGGATAALRQASRGQAVNYRLEGILGIEAGRLGQPTFGPMTLLTGTLR
jgi:hypothetical protein